MSLKDIGLLLAASPGPMCRTGTDLVEDGVVNCSVPKRFVFFTFGGAYLSSATPSEYEVWPVSIHPTTQP